MTAAEWTAYKRSLRFTIERAQAWMRVVKEEAAERERQRAAWWRRWWR